MRKLILLTGSPRGGKSTVARHLCLQHSLPVYSIGTQLKEHVNSMVHSAGLPGLETEKELWRPLLEAFGNASRILQPSVWISPTLRRMDDDKAKAAVIDDLRHPWDLMVCKSRGWETLVVGLAKGKDRTLCQEELYQDTLLELADDRFLLPWHPSAHTLQALDVKVSQWLRS